MAGVSMNLPQVGAENVLLFPFVIVGRAFF
jgi:hypothetical protein